MDRDNNKGTAPWCCSLLADKLTARMLRKRFQTVVFLAFLAFSLTMASENTTDDDEVEDELPQCPATSATPAKQTPKTQTDDDDDDSKADNEADDGDEGNGDGPGDEADNDDPPQEEVPCVPALEEQSIDDDTPFTNETVADETLALAGTSMIHYTCIIRGVGSKLKVGGH